MIDKFFYISEVVESVQDMIICFIIDRVSSLCIVLAKRIDHPGFPILNFRILLPYQKMDITNVTRAMIKML